MFRENKKTPEIRFPGFTEDWEQRKVSELADVTYGGGTPKTSIEQYWRGNIPWIQSSDIAEHDVNCVNPKKFISEEAVSKSATRLVPENSIAIVTRVGVGKLAIMPFPYTTSQDFLSLSKLKSDVHFTAYLLYKKMQNELHAVQGTSIKGITKEELLCKEVMLPELNEQEKIGQYFSNLDNLITLHQRKCDALQTLKKTMLQKMFPQKGASVPEIRFPSFTEDWEQRKLGDVTSVATFKPYLKEIDEDGEYEVIQQGDKPLAGYANGNPFEDYEKVTLFGDHTLSLYKAKAPFFVASDGVKILFSKDMNGYFYYYLLENYKPQSEGYKRHFSILKVCECSYPTNITEQRKIGEYFSNLDNLITLHQRKCDTLRELKKAMLQKMFV